MARNGTQGTQAARRIRRRYVPSTVGQYGSCLRTGGWVHVGTVVGGNSVTGSREMKTEGAWRNTGTYRREPLPKWCPPGRMLSEVAAVTTAYMCGK